MPNTIALQAILVRNRGIFFSFIDIHNWSMQLVAYCFNARNSSLNSFKQMISTYRMHSSHNCILWTQGNTSHQNVPSLSKSLQMKYAAWKIFPPTKLLFVTLLTSYNQDTMCTETNCILGKISCKIKKSCLENGQFCHWNNQQIKKW